MQSGKLGINYTPFNMAASLINGKMVAAELRAALKAKCSSFKRLPKLAAVIVGDRPDSATYVRMKVRACEEVGIESAVVRLGVDIGQKEMETEVGRLNDDPGVDGILIQLPLPSHLDERRLLESVDPSKDVDGFHASHLGLVAMGATKGIPISCTPKGIMTLLDYYGVNLEGKEVVVVGRSAIVGTPVALLAMRRSATVTMCHSRTKDLPSHLGRADVVIAACGQPKMIQGEWLKPGAVVIDVGINQVDAPETKRGTRLVGDVDFEKASKVASLITPVPGGVGPMTVASLLENVVEAYQRRNSDA